MHKQSMVRTCFLQWKKDQCLCQNAMFRCRIVTRNDLFAMHSNPVMGNFVILMIYICDIAIFIILFGIYRLLDEWNIEKLQALRLCAYRTSE